MPINARSIQLGHCYAAGGVVLKVVDVQGEMITYVVRDDKLAFPTTLDRQKWRTATRLTFSLAVAREVPCDWQRA
jgi:hypothetical protein